MKTYLLLSLAATLLAAGCKKDDPEAGLPPATQEGKNTGGCLINGERFVAASRGGGLLSNPTPALLGGFSFDSLYSLQLAGPNSTLRLFFRSQKTGNYLLNKDTQYYPRAGALYVLNHAVYSMTGSAGGEVYITSSRHTGQVSLNYASVSSGISAGTFEFTAASTTDPNKTVTVTRGRFDCKQ